MKLKCFLMVMLLSATCVVSVAQTKSASSKTSSGQVVASAEGVGPVKLLAPLAKIPASYAGLYDRIEKKAIDSQYNISGADYEVKFYKEGVHVMTANVSKYEGIYGGVRSIFIPEGSPLKVKIAKGQYMAVGDAAADVWKKTGKTILIDGISSCAPVIEGLHPITACYADDGENAKNVVFYVDKNDVQPNVELGIMSEWKSGQLKPGAKVKDILIFYWVNEF